MGAKVLPKLWDALDLRLSELLQADLYVGLAGGVGCLVGALRAPKTILQVVPVAASLVGVVIGAVIAGAALQAAFFDQPFLRKIRAIGRDPVRYLAPFLFTATIGVLGSLLLLVLATLSEQTTPYALVPLAGIAGLLCCWTIASLLPCMATLVQFINLKVDALDIPNDIAKPDS